MVFVKSVESVSDAVHQAVDRFVNAAESIDTQDRLNHIEDVARAAADFVGDLGTAMLDVLNLLEVLTHKAGMPQLAQGPGVDTSELDLP